MLHEQTHIDAAVAAVLLLGGVLEVAEIEGFPQQLGEPMCDDFGFVVVGGGQRVVVEGYAIYDRDKQERPVRAPLGGVDAAAIVHGEEYVGCFCEVRERGFEG